MNITPDVSLPDEILCQPMSILGRTGSGKTYAAKGIVEQHIAQGRRVCIIDPTGVWWGLRSAADGRSAGLQVMIFGGAHADVPIDEHAGEALGRVIGTSRIQCVVDLKDMLIGQQQRFMSRFLEAIYQHNREPIHLIVDEADEFAPKSLPKGAVDAAIMLGRFDRIARRGRTRGFRLLTITQRPAKLHNDVLGMAATLITMQLTLPHDRKAVEQWIKGQADLEKGKAVLDSLPRLKRGEGWVWCPDAEVLSRTHFPAIQTFDSSATPDDDAAGRQAVSLTAIDLGAVRDQLAAATKEAEASDPKKLRARIAELEKQAERIPTEDLDEHQCAKCGHMVRVPADFEFNKGDLCWQCERAESEAAMSRLVDENEDLELELATAKDSLQTIHALSVGGAACVPREVLDALAKLGAITPFATEIDAKEIPPRRGPVPSVAPSRAYATPTQPSANGVYDRPKTVSVRDGTARPPTPRAQGARQSGRAPEAQPIEGLEGPHLKILKATLELALVDIHYPSVELLGFVAGYIAGGGSFKTYISKLSTLGLVERTEGGICLTAAGTDAAPNASALTLADLHRRIAGVIDGPHWKILSALMDLSRPRGSREVAPVQLGEASGYEADGGSFKTYLSRLSTLGLVERSKGMLWPSAVVYPEGLK